MKNLKDLEQLRREIDLLDKKLVEVIAKRMKVVKEVGRLKKSNNLKPLDKKRWRYVIKTRKQVAKKLKVNESLIGGMFTLMHKYSLLEQKKV